MTEASPQGLKANKQWYARYPRDYQEDTSGLSLTEHGAYTVLLDHYYVTEKPLPASALQLQRICRALESHEVEAMHSVLRQFFVETPDGYRNERADKELAKRADISGKRSGAANSRHAASPAKAGAKPNAIAPANADTPTPTITDTESGGGGPRASAREVTDKVLSLIPRGHDTASLVGGSWQVVETWLSSGVDPERDIYPTVEQLVKTEPAPNTLKYFSKAIGRAMKTRLQTSKDIAHAAPNTQRSHGPRPSPLSGFAAEFADHSTADAGDDRQAPCALLHPESRH